ncbi:hypothetical protein KLP40_18070 [Hymenobacter sp. NST-14]|uniref:hypothetical protein n=1 Tax=Hymenobacter piscis TaxID=2839984 RepID=UPI001C02062E|nr:hypothetical protein [Hymenobacter piscis]MBT9395079.1 hypothetical protein [Hymenobacter piscis]
MKHRLVDKQSLGNGNWRVIIELLPDTPAEAKAIRQVELIEASEEERSLVENYLFFNLGLGNYSVVELLKQKNRHVALRIVM